MGAEPEGSEESAGEVIPAILAATMTESGGQSAGNDKSLTSIILNTSRNDQIQTEIEANLRVLDRKNNTERRQIVGYGKRKTSREVVEW